MLSEGTYAINAVQLRNSDAAGNNSTATTNTSSFTIDTSAPSISAITTDAFNWGAVLNTIEDNSTGTVDITTAGVETVSRLP